MLKKLEALRKQPKHVRNRYAFWTAALVSIVIALFWATTLPTRFSAEDAPVVAAETDTKTFVQTLSEVSAHFKETFANLRTNVEYTQEPTTPDNTLDLNALLLATTTRSEIVSTSSNSLEIGSTSPIKSTVEQQ